MRTTVIIEKRWNGYVATVNGRFGGGFTGRRCGVDAESAAAFAAKTMLEYASLSSNPDGGTLMAPRDVLDLVPDHLRSIDQ